MLKKYAAWLVLAFILASNAMALTSVAPVTAQMADGTGNLITSTGNALDLNLKTSSITLPVSGTFWQATQPVSGTFWQATQPVSIASMPSTPVTGTFFQATQPVSIASAIVANSTSGSRSDTFTTTSSGTTVNVATTPVKTFALAVKATGAVTSWTVVLEGSLDNSNFTTIMSHTNTVPGDGIIYWSGTNLMPVLYFRARCSAITLGGGTNVIATIVGM